MNKIITLTFISFIISFNGHAANFKFNYKNLNTLGSLICAKSQNISLKQNEVLSNSIKIEQISVGKKINEKIFEITGTCNAVYNTATKSFRSFGEELDISFNLNALSTIQGTLGLNNVIVNLQNSTIKSITLIDSLMGNNKKLDLSKMNWAPNNSLISFSDENKILLKLNRKIAAVEKNTILKIKAKTDISTYKIWSTNSFSCSKLSLEKCQQIVNKL